MKQPIYEALIIDGSFRRRNPEFRGPLTARTGRSPGQSTWETMTDQTEALRAWRKPNL
jgi:hypothetical protein